MHQLLQEHYATTHKPISVTKTYQLILQGQTPENMHVDGGSHSPTTVDTWGLSNRFTIARLDLGKCTQLEVLPDNLTVRHLNLAGCTTLQRLPNGLRCYDLNLQHTHIRSLPDDIQVEYRLDLKGCHELAELPAQLKVGLLVLRECTALQHLPKD
ncbi:MAG: hypothetical protein GFH27_549293n88 [Chloroflexi bacterium AL-W]|nr:hypothetical protein [Chloroflexi bacterium AL-N1]NOK67797.1 hypothetical protein [Chloroflexi bacterium AL-N10]NOK75433.1 hypothetical protein [Chloroflexi bacterium AL-N5]NOK82221.1 hypothetical protein [Chloroflexi bacterium AL-W]NOK90066.1 hypothetical protein [Chloroflexi bacterium AL-N15]